MKKIVINKCFGGFGLSHLAYVRYAELKGINLWIDKRGYWWAYWSVPDDLAGKELTDEEINNNDKIERLYDWNFERDDPCLVQVVEELESMAGDECARLQIVEIPDDVDWIISEYDGLESVEEDHRTWS